MSLASFLCAGIGAVLAWALFTLLISTGLTTPSIVGAAVFAALGVHAINKALGPPHLRPEHRIEVGRRRSERLAANGDGIGVV